MNRQTLKWFQPLIAAAIMLLLAAAAGCGPRPETTTEQSGRNAYDPAAPHPVVTIQMKDGGTIKVELYPEVAKNTVDNFISLASKGFYNGTIFHRVIPGFMIQGGDPEGTGKGGPGYSIKGEFNANGYSNNLKHTRGVISMARSGSSYDSAGSQFFIMVADATHLDGKYAAFGAVTEGMEMVDAIVNLPTGASDRPEDPPVMEKVTVELKGYQAAEPQAAE
ncbi:peptidylprolyl isomerase [Paenibacillus sambharensis]|uniref:Peptidyl-prolyl cis-trans isomerase n=1 Tax=Paenibacillus sambharensis TaxID=1803190 RepID=A0A2W1LUC9_9BACL|nr:peptidylprolyl isomerase [Paenibacillus sambharensis]PZD95391.1 peptidylprolyl isomerase [Paenibacillus sambharensis]